MANLLSTSVTGTITATGNVTAPTFVGALSGNATSATTATSATSATSATTAGSVTGLTLTSSANGINPDNVTQNQIGYNTSVSLFSQTDGGLYSSAYSSVWIHQIYGDFRTGQIAIRGKNNGTWQAWRSVLDSSNFSSWAAAASHSHSYLPLSGGDLTGSIGVPSGSSVFLATSGDTNWRIGRNLVTESDNTLAGSTMQFIAANVSDQGWQFVNSAGKTIVEISAYTNGGLFVINQKELWLKQPVGGRLTTIRKKVTDSLSPNNVKIADTSLAAYSANGNPNTYIIIQTLVPQDEYQMGGFTIDLFARYNDTNGKTKIDLGGYWNPESNSGFQGWEAHGTNPQLKPTIQVARNVNNGYTAIILSGISWDYPVVVARDLYLGYNSADGAGYGYGWHIYSSPNIDEFSNADTVVWRNAYSDSNPSGYITSSSSISGNAATATTLATARTLTIGSTGKTFNGSANVSWTLAEIGAQAAGSYAASSHTHTPSQVGLGNVTNAAQVTTSYNSSLNSDSRNSRGVTRLYRRDDDSDFSVQTYWTGARWRLYGYVGDSDHADTHVGYADAAGSATANGGQSDRVVINYNDNSNANYQMLWGSGNNVYGTANIYCNPSTNVVYAAAFYDSDNTGYYLDPNSYSNLYTARAYEWQTHAGAGYGVKFWGGSNNYSIQMSEVGNGSWGGRVAGETTSDYNMYFTMTGGTNRGFVFRNSVSSGGAVAGIDASGNFRAVGDVIVYSSSDARLKDNVKPIENALDKIMQIRGVEFDWNNNQDAHTGHDIGVIAQEVEAVLPEIVTTRDTGYKAVKYEKLTALLIETVKELKAEIDDLRAQLNSK